MDYAMLGWVRRNEESLRAEYRSYAIQHDYDPDGVMSFDAWVRRRYAVELEVRKYEHECNELLIPDDPFCSRCRERSGFCSICGLSLCCASLPFDLPEDDPREVR